MSVAAYPLHYALNLPRRNGNAAGLLPMSLGFQGGRLIGTLQANELGQGGRVAPLQSQRRGGGIMAGVLARMAVIIPQ